MGFVGWVAGCRVAAALGGEVGHAAVRGRTSLDGEGQRGGLKAALLGLDS